MIRLMGALLVAAGGAWLGLRAAWELERRARDMEAMAAALTLLERELTYRLTPMPELLAGLASRAAEPAGTFFRAASARLKRGERLSDAWSGALADLPPPEARWSPLEPLGQVLGRYEGDNQGKAIAAARRELEEVRRHQREESRRLGQVYRALGATGGAFLTILLL